MLIMLFEAVSKLEGHNILDIPSKVISEVGCCHRGCGDAWVQIDWLDWLEMVISSQED